MPGERDLAFRALGQPRDLTRAVGVRPIQILGAGLGPIGRERDAPAVGRPHRAVVITGSEGLETGDVKIPVGDFEMPAYYAMLDRAVSALVSEFEKVEVGLGI